MSAKIDLKFIDCYCGDDFIKVNHNTSSELDFEHIRISGESFNADDFEILLDKSTAIKFAKTLRTEINKIQD